MTCSNFQKIKTSHSLIQIFKFFLCINFVLFDGFVESYIGNALGTDFFIALPPLATLGDSNRLIPDDPLISVIITTESFTHAAIFLGTGQVIGVDKFYQYQRVNLPSFLIPYGSGTSTLGIHVQTQNISGVQVIVTSSTYGSEGSLVAPAPGLLDFFSLNGASENPSFSIMGSSKEPMTIGLEFPDGTKVNQSLKALEILHLTGTKFLGTIVRGPGIAVFSGRDCTNQSGDICSHLLEQMSSVFYWPDYFYFVNPSLFDDDLRKRTPLLNYDSCTLSIVNLNNSAAKVKIPGRDPILLNQAGSMAFVSTSDPFLFIESNGAIDIQAICGSIMAGNQTQVQLLGAFGTTNVGYFYVEPDTTTKVLVLVYEHYFNETGSYLKFNEEEIDFSTFNWGYSGLAIKEIIPKPGFNIMRSSINPLVYIYEYGINKTNMGTIIGKSF